MQAVQFLDTAENICDIAQMVGEDVTVSYADPDEPVLIVSNGDKESVLALGMWLVKMDDGRLLILTADIVHDAVIKFMETAHLTLDGC